MGILNAKQRSYTVAVLRLRLRTLRWLVPVGMALLVVAYELVVGRWLMDRFGGWAHTAGEILLFGTVGPLLTFVVLDFFGRWLDERDTSDLQAKLMREARADVNRSRALVDDAVQALFSAGALVDALQVEAERQGVDTGAILVAETQRALDTIVGDLRAHLQETPHWVDGRQ